MAPAFGLSTFLVLKFLISIPPPSLLEGNSFSYTGKSCLEPENCEPGPFSLTYPHNVTVRANIACCDTDGCNAGAIPVPTVSSVPNGRQCLSFFKSGADHWQKKKELLACTGAEDHCVEDYGVLTLAPRAFDKPQRKRYISKSSKEETGATEGSPLAQPLMHTRDPETRLLLSSNPDLLWFSDSLNLPACSGHCRKCPATMWAPQPLCLLSAQLVTGDTLQCEVCASEEQSCAGPLQLCAPWEGTCVTVVAEFRLERNSFSYMGKSCLEPKNCEPGPFSLTYAHNVTVRVNIACCDTDGCNAGAIPVPSVSSVPNGRQCPSFFKMGADGWQEKEKELLVCTGAEDHYVEESGILTLDKFSRWGRGDIKLRMTAAGCGSPGACVKRALVKKYAQGVPEILSQAKCYPVPRAGGGIGEP
ncbi:uncharacterized protein [Lepidochelys kempii]|uniref:uncharacterized protein n=1 Tax=Lepidochelys kempii TaxID=8472 RepID=UPI003C70373B